MGAGGIPNRGVERVDGRSSDLPVRGAKPNSRYDLYSNDVRIQSRWFDSKGNVVRNRDYIHQNSKNDHFFHMIMFGIGAMDMPREIKSC